MALRPHRIDLTGDDRPVGGLYSFVWRMTGWRQLVLIPMALGIAALNVAPLELQRRIIDDAIAKSDIDLLILLGAFYLAAVVIMGLLKFLMRMYEGWLAEGTIYYCRRHLAGLWAARAGDEKDPEQGAAVSIIRAEIEQVGGFVGDGISEPASQAGVLLAVLGYMLVVEPKIALFSFIFILPQLVLTPLAQRRLNALTEIRLGMLRDVSDRTIAADDSDVFGRLVRRVYGNQMKFLFWKFASKAGLNLLNAAAPLAALTIGGYMVIQGETEIGVVIAFVSGFNRLSDPIRSLIAYYRLAAQTAVKHELIAEWLRPNK